MLQTLEEIKNVTLQSGQIVNGVDSPFLMSIDSTAPVQTEPDMLNEGEVETTSKESKDKALVKKETASKDEEKDTIQKRINELTRKWRSTERERDYERSLRLKEVGELQEELKKLQSKVPTNTRPDREQFDDLDAYYEAIADWKIEQKLKEVKPTLPPETTKTVEDKVEDSFDELLQQGADKYEDFNEFVLAKDLILTREMLEGILLLSNGVDVLYHLGKNASQSAALAKLSPLRIAVELGKLEEKLLAENQGEKVEPKVLSKTTPVKTTSKAPAPIVPVKVTGVTERDPATMSAREYRAWRERNKE